LAVYINASPQRRDAFYNLQPDEPKLVPIQDRPYEAPLGSFGKTINTSFLYLQALPGMLCRSQQLGQEWSVSLTLLGISTIIDEGL
ncbi:hypothetical protein PENSUB_4838, partial [Penicillium subrubescens]